MFARQLIEQALWKEFGVERAVLVLDMSGFSELCERHGIVHYLSMVRRMQATAEPIIAKYDGAWAIDTRRPVDFTTKLMGLWASSSSNVWAVGDGGALLHLSH